MPAGDPYLLHVSVLSSDPLGPGDFFELQTGTPLNAILTVTRRQNGAPTVAAQAGEKIANGLNNIAVTRAATLMNTGGEWTFVGT